MYKKAWNSEDTANLALLSSLAGSGAYISKNHHINDYNPFGKKTVSVIGGIKPWDYSSRQEAAKILDDAAKGIKVSPDKLNKAKKVFMLDSFSSQSQSAADALKNSGFDVSFLRRSVNNASKPIDNNTLASMKRMGIDTSPIDKLVRRGDDVKVFDAVDFYRPLDLTLKDLKGSDAVLQVGDSANSAVLRSARRKGKKLYRLLTDYGDGNFLQPDEWLGGQNWMKVRDPSLYNRLFVPGGAESGLWNNLGHGTNKNVAIGDIAVSPLFEKMVFKHHGGPNARAILTVGGGAGSSMTFANRFVPESQKYNFIGKNNSLFDDIIGALRAKHGDAANLDVYLGTTITKPQFTFDRATNKVIKAYQPSDIKLSKKLQQLSAVLNNDRSSKLVGRLETTEKGRNLLEYIRRRYKGVNLIDHAVPQSDIANAYRSSDYIFALPGSTTAEFSSIRGDRHGGLIHLIPPDEQALPRHFIGNAKYTNRMMQPSAKHNIVSLDSKDRYKKLLDAVTEGGFKNWGRRGTTLRASSSLAPMVKTIYRDIALKRLSRVGKLGLLLTPGVLGGTYLTKKLLAKEKPEDNSLSGKLKKLVENIKSKLK